MSYTSLSAKDIKEMMSRIGISSMQELFRTIPEGIRLKGELKVPSALTEIELIHHFEKIAKQNKYSEFLSFL